MMWLDGEFSCGCRWRHEVNDDPPTSALFQVTWCRRHYGCWMTSDVARLIDEINRDPSTWRKRMEVGNEIA